MSGSSSNALQARKGKGGKKKTLNLGKTGQGEKWSWTPDAALALSGIIASWVTGGGYVGLYQTSDGGALVLSLKHDDYDVPKQYLHDSEDIFELEKQFRELTDE